jgi:hypothetical protein
VGQVLGIALENSFNAIHATRKAMTFAVFDSASFLDRSFDF